MRFILRKDDAKKVAHMLTKHKAESLRVQSPEYMMEQWLKVNGYLEHDGHAHRP